MTARAGRAARFCPRGQSNVRRWASSCRCENLSRETPPANRWHLPEVHDLHDQRRSEEIALDQFVHAETWSEILRSRGSHAEPPQLIAFEPIPRQPTIRLPVTFRSVTHGRAIHHPAGQRSVKLCCPCEVQFHSQELWWQLDSLVRATVPDKTASGK